METILLSISLQIAHKEKIRPPRGDRITAGAIAGVSLFADLPAELLGDLAAELKPVRYAKREFVMHKGDRYTDLLFLLEGRLMVVDITPEGRQTGLNFIAPGEFFGELASIDGLPRSATVVAAAPSLVAMLPRHAARKLIFCNPTVAERMLKHVSLKLRASIEYRILLSIPNAFGRVFTLLHMLAKPDPGGLLTVENMPTHEQIGLMTNTSRETVTRALQVLYENDVLEKDGRRAILRMPAKLSALVEQHK